MTVTAGKNGDSRKGQEHQGEKRGQQGENRAQKQNRDNMERTGTAGDDRDSRR